MDSLSLLIEMFGEANREYLQESLSKAKGNVSLAAELFLSLPKPPSSGNRLRQTTITQFVPPVTKAENILVEDLTGDSDEEKSNTQLKDGFQLIMNKRKASEELQPEKKEKKTVRKPIFLYHPQQVAESLPVTSLHLNFLPVELSRDLLEETLRDSLSWNKYQLYLFEREVESRHDTSSYFSDKPGAFPPGDRYFVGKKQPRPTPFSSVMSQAAKLIQDFINQQRKNRPRHRLDLAPEQPWLANFAAANLYASSKNSVGWHTDRLSYIGPRPIIASLSLGVTRHFRLRNITPKSDSTIHDVSLPHNSLFIMWGPTQEEYKHCVPTQTTLTPHPISGTKRLNLTFRYYSHPFGPQYLPKCDCGIACELRVINQDPTQFGRYYLKCVGANSSGDGCGLFKFIEFPDHPTSVSKPTFFET